MKRLETIYVVFKTHFDIGFTGLAKEIVDSYQGSMLKSVLDTCEATEKNPEGHRYIWTMSSWPLKKSLETKDAEMQKRALQLVAEDKLTWHALPFTTHTDFCGIEEFVRGIGIAAQLDLEFGKKHIAAKMTDVPGHTRMLPSLLSKAGIRFLHLGCNACVNPPEVPRCFYWKGPDGSGVTTFYTKGGYGTDLLPPDDWEYPVWLALMNTSDNKGPHSAQIIHDIVEEVEKKSPGTKVIVGSLDDFARSFLACEPQLPVIYMDLADSWIHGVGTYPVEVSRIRRLRKELLNVEAALSLREISTGNQIEKGTRELINAAYENILLFDEHTWGLDTKKSLLPLHNGGRVYEKELFLDDKKSGAYRLIEESWKEQSEYVNNAFEAVAAVTGKVAGNSDKSITVYNLLSWERDAAADVTGLAKAGQVLVDEDGSKYPIKEYQGRCVSVLRKLPPIGCRAYTIEEAAIKPAIVKVAVMTSDAGVCLENKKLSVVIDGKTGMIISFYDKINRKEWTAENGAFGGYTYDIHGKSRIIQYLKDYAYDFEDWYIADNGRPWYPWIDDKTYFAEACIIESNNTEDTGVATVSWKMPLESVSKYGNAPKVIMTVTLGVDDAFADIAYEIMGKAETPFVESGHFIFSLNADSPQYAVQKMGAVVDPMTDIQYGANTSLYCCDRWMNITDDGLGIAFFPKDSPLLSIGGNRIYIYSKDYKPQTPILYWNAFNNQWGTNFPQWRGGDLKYEFRIYPYAGSWQTADVAKMAEEYATPLFIVKGEAHNRLLAENIDNATVLCFKGADNGDGYILRLQENKGTYGELSLRVADGCSISASCSLMEENMEEYTENLLHLSVKTAPFEVHTFRIIRKQEGEYEA